MDKVTDKMPRVKYFFSGLIPDMIKRAKEEIGETEEVKAECLKELKRLIKEEPDLRSREDDAFLIRFLRTRKFNVEKAFKTIKLYYTFKARYSGILTDFRPSDVKHILEQGHLNFLEYRDENYCGIGVSRCGMFNVDEVTSDDILVLMIMIAEIGLEPDATQIFGNAMILDFSGFNMRSMKLFASPTFIYRFVTSMQDIFPIRVKAIHVVNEPFYCNIIFNIMRTLMSEKLNKRLYLHGSNIKGLHKHISPDILPEEFGGKMGPFADSAKSFTERILSREDHFVQINKYGYQDKTLEKLTKDNPKAILT